MMNTKLRKKIISELIFYDFKPVFISYSHSDEKRLESFFNNIQNMDFTYDRLFIKHDEKYWFIKIIYAIYKCQILLCVGNWHFGYMTLMEIIIAIVFKKKVLFLHI